MAHESRLLIADEDQQFLSSTAQQLARHGYEVETVASAAALQHAFARQAHDLLIVDLNLKGNEELLLLRDLLANWPDYPVIVVTAFPSVPTAVESLRLRVLDYVVKPLDVDDFVARVESALLKGKVLRTIRSARDAWNQLEQQLQNYEQSLVQAGALAGDQAGTGAMNQLLDNLAQQFRQSAAGLLDAYAMIQSARRQDVSEGSSINPRDDRRHFDQAVHEILDLLKDAEQKGEVSSLANVRKILETLLN